MNMMTMYMLTRLDALSTFFHIISIASVLVILATTLMAFSEDEFPLFDKRWVKYSFIALTIGVLGSIFTPSTKEMAAIIIVPKIANSTAVQKDVPELYDLGVEWLKEKLTTGNK